MELGHKKKQRRVDGWKETYIGKITEGYQAGVWRQTRALTSCRIRGESCRQIRVGAVLNGAFSWERRRGRWP